MTGDNSGPAKWLEAVCYAIVFNYLTEFYLGLLLVF